MDDELKARLASYELEHKALTPDTRLDDVGLGLEDYPGITLGEYLAMEYQKEQEQTQGIEIVRQALTFSISRPEFLQQIKRSPEWRTVGFRDEFRRQLRSMGIADEAIAHLDEQEQDLDEAVVRVDSPLGQDVARLVDSYFPGSKVLAIASKCHDGYFIGDYAITLDVKLDHPTVQGVGMMFNQMDVPWKPKNWHELVTCAGINLFLTKIILVNPVTNKPVVYKIPGMYQQEIEKWCESHSAMLCQYHETSDLFIIAIEGAEVPGRDYPIPSPNDKVATPAGDE